MKREDIEKAANEKFGDNSFAYKGFIEGAEWRINSVWHDAREQPKEGVCSIIVRTACGSFTSWFVTDDIIKVFEKFGVTIWAYIEDLIPKYKR